MSKITLSSLDGLFGDSFNCIVEKDLFGHFIKAHIFDPAEVYFKSRVTDPGLSHSKNQEILGNF